MDIAVASDGVGISGKEVIHGDAIKVSGETKAPERRGTYLKAQPSAHEPSNSALHLVPRRNADVETP